MLEEEFMKITVLTSIIIILLAILHGVLAAFMGVKPLESALLLGVAYAAGWISEIK